MPIEVSECLKCGHKNFTHIIDKDGEKICGINECKCDGYED